MTMQGCRIAAWFELIASLRTFAARHFAEDQL